MALVMVRSKNGTITYNSCPTLPLYAEVMNETMNKVIGSQNPSRSCRNNPVTEVDTITVHYFISEINHPHTKKNNSNSIVLRFKLIWRL